MNIYVYIVYQVPMTLCSKNLKMATKYWLKQHLKTQYHRTSGTIGSDYI